MVNSNQNLKRLVWIVSLAVILCALAFGGYYYWDRYVHVGDQSPLEKNITHLEKLVADKPQDADTRLALAQYYLENARYAEAITQAQQVSTAYPDNDSSLLILGMAYTKSGQTEAALKPLEAFVSIHRKSEMADVDSKLEAALYFLGEDYVRLNQSQKAVPALTDALSIDRTDADAMYQLGLAYIQGGKLDLAVEKFQNAVLFVPDFGDAYSRMAESYAALAMPDYVIYARGMEAYVKHDYPEARRLLEQSVARLPDFLQVHIGLGITYEQLGDFAHARQSFERALVIAPTNFTASNALARVKLLINGTSGNK